MSPPPKTVTVEHTAAVLGISKTHAYRQIKAGNIPAVKLGRKIVVPESRLEDLLAGRPV